MPRRKRSELKKQLEPGSENGSAPATVQESVTEPATVPAIPDPKPERTGSTIYVECPVHPDVTFRHGGFCERCYAEKNVERMARIDEALETKIISQLDDLVQQIINTKDYVLIERLIGRILNRFQKPQEHRVTGAIKALHLHAPVDFGKGR